MLLHDKIVYIVGMAPETVAVLCARSPDSFVSVSTRGSCRFACMRQPLTSTGSNSHPSIITKSMSFEAMIGCGVVGNAMHSYIKDPWFRSFRREVSIRSIYGKGYVHYALTQRSKF